MLLYELAITLDRRSTELVDAATELGLGHLQAGSDLDAKQLAALRAHFGAGVAPPPLAPLGSAPPLPAPPTAPLAFGAPPPPVGAPVGAPTAPAAWGPPTAPGRWGPPPAAVPPAAPPDGAPPATAAHIGPAFAYPDSPIAQEAAPAGAPSPASGGPLPPPPDPVPGAAPASAPGFGTGQKVLIGAVVVGVIALFGFMAVNTGPDKERQQALATKQAELEADLNATTAPIATTTEAPATPAAPPTAYDIVDVTRFCKGGLGITTFELRLAAALADQDFEELSSIVRDRRAAWSDDVASLVESAPPILVDDIELYRDGYNTFFDAVASSSSMEQAYRKVDRMQLIKAGNAGQEVSTQIANECK
ncbi:MAG TPA: hypothetical protein VNQ33_00565 [Acidimicrobiales bacterium]|nr:hypothetical protein [Acidimicrobiales bacterium]